jgi:Flp pilus assembly protein TadD
MGLPFTRWIKLPILRQIYERCATARARVAFFVQARRMPVDLRAAAEDLRSGRYEQAARACEAALEHNPDDADALFLLGSVALRRGSPRQAVTLLGRAAAVRPHDAASHCKLGEAYFALGEMDQALASCRQAIACRPSYPEAHTNLAVILLRRREVDAAIGAFREAIRQQPSFAEAHNGLGNALWQKGDRTTAIAHYKRAAALDPNWAEARSNLGRALLQEGDPAQALVESQEAARLNPQSAPILTALANVLLVHNRALEARDRLLEAVRLEPNAAAVHLALAFVWERMGEFDQSHQSLREALRCEPGHPTALARLATGLRGKLPEDDRAEIRRLLADPGLPDHLRWPLQSGLAQVLDATGQFDRAAELSIDANALMLAQLRRQGRAYDPRRHQALVSQVILTFTREYFARVRGFGLDSERPVFIVGMPRSGTSLTEQVLASHPRVFGAGELWLARDTLESVPAAVRRSGDPLECIRHLDREAVGHLARGYLEKLRAFHASADRIVDKLPDNTFHLGFIATLFPRAKIIHCRRDMRDVALSCWMTTLANISWSCDPEFIAGRIHEYRRIMEHWRRVLPIAMFELDYETLVEDLEGTARQLVAWCGLEWDARCLEFHKTERPVRSPSAVQVRQPLYKSSVGRWKNYERSLAPLFAKLAN